MKLSALSLAITRIAAGAAAAAFKALASGGTLYTTTRSVLSSGGTAYAVGPTVLSSGGTPYTPI